VSLGNSYPLLFNDPPAVANMTLSSSYALIQVGHRKPLQELTAKFFDKATQKKTRLSGA
jgi:hypothetical protein